jgi:hypothetical protein
LTLEDETDRFPETSERNYHYWLRIIALKKAALIPVSFYTAGSELYHSGTKVPVKSLAIFLHN